MGWVVITPEEVSAEIEKRVAAFAEQLRKKPDSKAVKKYRKSLSTHNTFFTAESVWYAAAALGRTGVPERITVEFTGTLTPEILAKKHLIFLGKISDGSHHAVGARFGYIYDSLNDGPAVPLNDANLRKIYSEVLGIFYF